MQDRSVHTFAAMTTIILITVAIIYWPVIHANFVWDDVVNFHDQAWLRVGDAWKHYVFRDFSYWTNYFRPLGVAFFTLQIRVFSDSPEPMHAVSLGLHLINTFLVGLLSWICLLTREDRAKGKYLAAITMLFYGLNPLLIEAVAWIGCQFDLVVTLLVLLGILTNSTVRNIYWRTGLVAILFFFAACTKESSISYPLILFIFEWLLKNKSGKGLRADMFALIQRSWPIYAATFAVGIAYLAFRHWALGTIVNLLAHDSLTVTGRIQEVCFLYLHYWKMLLWAMTGLSPIHPVDELKFNTVTLPLALTDMAAVGIFLLGLYLLGQRKPIIGCMIIVVTVALLPVLHLASVNFDSSLYHERYAMTALAAICPMLPLAFVRMPSLIKSNWLILPVLTTALFLWLVLAVMNIRGTLPLWANNANLWHWAVVENPDSVEAKDGLLSAYIDTRNYVAAHRLIEELIIHHVDCANCLLNAAILDISENNPEAAAKALDQLKSSKQLVSDKKMFRSYLLTTGQMLVLQGNLHDAEAVLRAAIASNPLDPEPRISLALALAFDGEPEEARTSAESGIAMLPASDRESRREEFDKAILNTGAMPYQNQKF